MISVREADAHLAQHLPELPVEPCPLRDAVGRVLRADLRADRDQPPFDRVMMDGIAIAFTDWETGCRRFAVDGVQGAGQAPMALAGPGHAVEVMTGAVLPDGADCVIRVEDITRTDAMAEVQESAAAARHQHIHQRGTDRTSGTLIVAAGARLRPPEIAIAASIGAATLPVTVPPRVAVVSTGDELVDVSETPLPHQIRRSNGYAIEAGLRTLGIGSVELEHAADDPATITARLDGLLSRCDLLILSGGVSMGRFDYVPGVLHTLGVNCVFHKVAQRPGKPMWFGMSRAGQPVFALPGNPVSASVCFQRYVAPFIASAMGLMAWPRPRYRLGREHTFMPALTQFLPVALAAPDDGGTVAMPHPVNSSGDFGALSATSGFVELPADTQQFPAGFAAPYYDWS